MRFRIPRIFISETEDLRILPGAVRTGMMDALRFFLSLFKVYDPAIEKIRFLSDRKQDKRILDLASGAGGVWPEMIKKLPEYNLMLSDIFPQEFSCERIEYLQKPLNVLKVEDYPEGVCTFFTGFHHLKNEEAKEFLRKMQRENKYFLVMEGGGRSLWGAVLSILFIPVSVLMLMPFFKPFRLSNIVFTYLIPLIPILTGIDGALSFLKLFNPDEIEKMFPEKNDYHFETGFLKHPHFPVKLVYIMGYPSSAEALA